MPLDYTILAAARIPLSTYQKVLTQAGSPLAASYEDSWAYLTSLGVDPAFALAQWLHESDYGLLGAAVAHHNPGNLRLSPGMPVVNGFAQFPDWLSGVRGYANLIAGPLYGQSTGYNTALKMPFRYAPSADNNDPAAYGAAMVQSISGFIAMSPAVTGVDSMLNMAGYPKQLALKAGTALYETAGAGSALTTLHGDATVTCFGRVKTPGGGWFLVEVDTSYGWPDNVQRATGLYVYINGTPAFVVPTAAAVQGDASGGVGG